MVRPAGIHKREKRRKVRKSSSCNKENTLKGVYILPSVQTVINITTVYIITNNSNYI
jgi:hypothetical protein